MTYVERVSSRPMGSCHQRSVADRSVQSGHRILFRSLMCLKCPCFPFGRVLSTLLSCLSVWHRPLRIINLALLFWAQSNFNHLPTPVPGCTCFLFVQSELGVARKKGSRMHKLSGLDSHSSSYVAWLPADKRPLPACMHGWATSMPDQPHNSCTIYTS